MGKKVKDSSLVLDTPITKKYTDPLNNTGLVLPTIGSPTKSQSQSAQQTQTFQSDSDYDKGLGFGVDQNKLRARNQGIVDELGNLIPQTVGGIGLGVLENAGYLGDLVFDWDNSKDYTNALVEIAKAGREKLNQSNPIYRQDNDTWSMGDSAWWVQNAQGLLESIGEFGITGGVGGSLLSKSALKLAQKLGTGTKALQGGAQLLTASALSEVEGAMSGANIYKEVYTKELGKGTSQEEANNLASDAASKTVRLNTVINTGLNLTSVAPLFKTFGKLDDAVNQQLHRLPNESNKNFLDRITQVANTNQSSKAAVMSVLGREALQEGVEEQVNLFAESEGKIEGGLEKSTNDDPVNRFINKAFSSEGLLNFVLGSIGGVGQTAAVNYAPLYKNEKGDRISLESLNNIKDNDQIKQAVTIFKSDLETLFEKQKNLTKAVESKNETEIEIARRELFDVAGLKSVRSGDVQPLVHELQKISTLDNNTEDEKGITPAMAAGVAVDKFDNDYKLKAGKLAADLPGLAKDYRNLQQQIGNDAVTNEVFKTRLAINSLENTLNDYRLKGTEIETELAKISDPLSLEVLKHQTDIEANDKIIKYLDSQLGKDEVNNLALTRHIEGLKQAKIDIGTILGNIPNRDKAKTINNGLVNQLKDNYSNTALVNSKLNEAKRSYTEQVNNAKNIAKELNKQVEQQINEAIRIKKEKTNAEEKQSELASLQNKQEQSTKKLETSPDGVTTNPPATNPTTTELPITTTQGEETVTPIIDQKAQELAEHIMQGGFITGENIKFYEDNKDLVNNKTKEIQDNYKSEIQNITDNVVPTEYEGRNKDTENKEEEVVNNSNKIEAPNIYGNQNKIAYAAKERSTDNELTLNPSYKILHSAKFTVGTEITLKVDKSYKDYDKLKDDIPNLPIGIYYKEKLVGYYPRAGENKQNLLIREYIIQKGEVNTKITRKTPGKLIKADKVKSLLAFAITPNFAIGKEGKYFIDTNITAKDSPSEISEEGYVYAMIPLPTGKMVRLSVDIDKISDEVALSVSNAINIYLNRNSLTEEQSKVVSTIFEDYNYNLITKEGLREYVDNFIRTTDLNDPKIVSIYNKKDSDIHRLSVQGNSVYYMKKGVATEEGKAPEFSANNPDAVYSHVKQMFARVNVAKIKSNKSINLPLINLKEDKIIVTPYEVKDYKTYIAQNTSTNLRSIKLSETEQTVTVQPSLFFDVSFVEAPKTENKTIIIGTEPKQKVILGTSKGFSSQIAKTPLSTVSPDQVDQKAAEELKENCTKGIVL